ncbi:hypothetical protein GOODEAATRI_015699, partial [Goodea atripinnis]
EFRAYFETWMALPCVRLCPRHMGPALHVCGYATLSRASRPQEKSSGGPVFQYVGEHRQPTHKVFVWGFSFTGALGIPSFVVPDSGRKKPRKYQFSPYRLETAEQISSAACGYGFTLMASSTKDVTKLWGMGLNKDSQLGFQRTQHSRHKSYDYVLEPSPVALPLIQPQQTRVVQVSCGRAHSLVLTDQEGDCLCLSCFISGSHVIHRIEGFSSRVVQVACGQDHSLFLTDTGKVFSCGWGADGQTGLGHHSISSCPVEVGGDLGGVEVQQISTYGDCSLAVSRDGQLFGWGNSEYRQLSLATESTQLITSYPNPNLYSTVEIMKKIILADSAVSHTCPASQTQQREGRISDITLRRAFTIKAREERGEVFVWGYGILGKGPKLSESSSPELIPPTLFGRSEFSPSAAVVRIRCGLSHFAAVT